jgi:hypothetical protein
MRTEELINALAADHAGSPRPQPLRQTFVWAMAAGIGLAALAFALIMGVRQDVASAVQTWRYDLKIAIMLTLAIASAKLVWQLARPAANARPAELGLAAAPLLLLFGILAELWTIPESRWLPRAIGTNSTVCIASITVLSLAPLVAAFYALRRGAPLNPGFAGAAAGLLASAIAAALYALHCPDDSPLFAAIWYPIAIGLVSFGGWFAGRRLLRW